VKSTWFQKYLLPGFVFQSVVIGGGYGTGRELAEFFLTNGPVGGLLGMMLVSTVIWSLVCAVTFEFARVFRSNDYRAFFTHLLGRGWILFEICYFLLLLIILAVIAATAGTILEETFALDYTVGVVVMMAVIGFLVFRGSRTIERVLATWSLVLYGVFFTLFIWCMIRFSGEIGAALGAGGIGSGWFVDGVRYAAYNLAVIPAVFFCIKHLETRREAVSAGLLSGLIGIIPAFLFFMAMTGFYPEIVNQPVPATFMIGALGSHGFLLVYQVVLYGTLIETGTGMIHAINERIAGVYTEKNRAMPVSLRPAVALALLVLGAVLARFGLIDLIAKGYGTLTWLFLLIFVIPILTRGIWLIRVRGYTAA